MKLYQLLVESRIDFLKDKYIPLLQDYLAKLFVNKSLIDTPEGKKRYESFFKQSLLAAQNTINKAIAIDPTNNKIYTQWLLNKLLNLKNHDEFSRIVNEDAYKWKEYLTIYNKVKSKLPLEQRDINKLNLNDLKDIALQYKEKENEVGTKNEVLDKKYKINENNEYLVYMFKTATKQDFQFYQLVSTNTEWCTRPNYDTFAEYIEEGPLFVFINKNNRNKKYQWHFESGQFMDENDENDWVDEDDININFNEFNDDGHFPSAISKDSLFYKMFILIFDKIKFKRQLSDFLTTGEFSYSANIVFNLSTKNLLKFNQYMKVELDIRLDDNPNLIRLKTSSFEHMVFDENLNPVFGPAREIVKIGKNNNYYVDTNFNTIHGIKFILVDRRDPNTYIINSEATKLYQFKGLDFKERSKVYVFKEVNLSEFIEKYSYEIIINPKPFF